MIVNNKDGSYDDVYWDHKLKVYYGFHYPKRTNNIRISLPNKYTNVQERKITLKINYSKS